MRSKTSAVLTQLEVNGEKSEFRIVRDRTLWAGMFGTSSALIGRCADDAVLPAHPLSWAAFAYRAHQPTPEIATKGPAEIDAPPLSDTLSFGAVEPASVHFGQL